MYFLPLCAFERWNRKEWIGWYLTCDSIMPQQRPSCWSRSHSSVNSVVIPYSCDRRYLWGVIVKGIQENIFLYYNEQLFNVRRFKLWFNTHFLTQSNLIQRIFWIQNLTYFWSLKFNELFKFKFLAVESKVNDVLTSKSFY